MEPPHTTITTAATSQNTHILIYPFPSSGHTIPYLRLSHHLLLHKPNNLTITFILIPSTSSLLTSLLPLFPTTLHPLLLHPLKPEPFTPPPHEQSVFDKMFALQTLNPQIISWFNSHTHPPQTIISDFFLGFTNSLALELGIKRLVFSTSGALALNVMNSLYLNKPDQFIKSDDGDDGPVFSFSDLPGSPVFRNYQLLNLYPEVDLKDEEWKKFVGFWSENIASHGMVVNTLTELESVHLEYLKTQLGHERVFAVGPLALGGERNETPPFHEVMTWLDEKDDDSVVYVCFGSRTVLTRQQLNALSIGLERSGVDFILCIGGTGDTKDTIVDHFVDLLEEGYENRVAGKGFVVRGWAPQVEILRHRAVGTFVTHCGWNSVLEGLSCGVVMLTWPMGAEQFVNAKLVIDEVGVGIRLGESIVNVPDADEVARLVIDAVRGRGKERAAAVKMKEMALTAVNGGSSKTELDNLVESLTQF